MLMRLRLKGALRLMSVENLSTGIEASASGESLNNLSLIHISEPTRPLYISYAVFCLKKKREKKPGQTRRRGNVTGEDSAGTERNDDGSDVR